MALTKHCSSANTVHGVYGDKDEERANGSVQCYSTSKGCQLSYEIISLEAAVFLEGSNLTIDDKGHHARHA